MSSAPRPGHARHGDRQRRRQTGRAAPRGRRPGRGEVAMAVRVKRPTPDAAAGGLAGLGAIVGLMRTDLLPALTVDEAAARMGVGRKHVLELVRAGELRTILVGTDRRIP